MPVEGFTGRRPFGGTTADFVDQVSTTGALLATAGATCVFYNAPTGGQQVVDLLNSDGTPTTFIVADGYGMIPPFQGPNDGTAYLWVTAGGTNRQRIESTDVQDRLTILEVNAAGGAIIPVGPKVANYNAAVGQFVKWDTTAASYVMTLPTAPAAESIIGAKIVVLGTGHTVTVNCGGSDVFNRTGGPTSIVLSVLDQAVQMEYVAGIWLVTGIDLPLSELDKRYLTVTTVWTTGALSIGVNAVDATAGAKTPTLPTPTLIGQIIAVEKTDTSVNTVAISGTIRGSAGTITLMGPNEAVVFVAESLSSWRPYAGHKTKTWLDSLYDHPKGAWVTATNYIVNDIVVVNGTAFRCITAHTAGGTFSGAGANWEAWGQPVAALGQPSSTAPVTATSGTIAVVAGTGLSRVAPAGNITGVILTAGTVNGQTVTVVNEAAFTITFAVAGTSHVADGTSDVIAASTARVFVWDGVTSLWYRCG